MFTARYGLYLLVQSVDPTQTDVTQPQHIPVTVPRHLRPAVSMEICNSRSMTTAVLPYYCTKFAAGRDLGNKVKVTCNRPPWQSNRDAQIATTACPPDIERTLTAHRVMRSGFDDEKGNMTQVTDFTKAFFKFRMSYGVTAQCKCNSFCPRKQSTAFRSPIFTKLADVQQQCVCRHLKHNFTKSDSKCGKSGWKCIYVFSHH